jgi:photosystem II biogenesis protein Psp29
MSPPVNNVRTVSDTKRDFYKYHTRPINSIYQRVVEELMVEMHLLTVNADFHYDPIYALGVTTSFNRFMQGYRPERDKDSIFNALCKAVGDDPERYKQDAEKVQSLANSLTEQELISWLSNPTPRDDTGNLYESIQEIANNPHFKYSRLFAVGFYTLLETADSESVKDEKERNQAIKQVAEALHLPQEKMQKDLELYRSNLEKFSQAQLVLQEALNADRKKREKLAQENNQATPSADNSQESGASKNEAPSS